VHLSVLSWCSVELSFAMIFISLVLTRKVEIEFVVAKAKAKDKCNHDDALNRQCKTKTFSTTPNSLKHVFVDR
jgi:hypothetical protein